MYYKYFFFDFDGMLMDTYAHTTTAFVKALNELREQKIEYQQAYDHLKISFYDAYDYFKVTKSESDLFSKYHTDINFKPEATLFLPVINILKSINNNGGKCFIYTNREDKTLFEYLEKFDIKKYFTDFITSANKPSKEPLLEMINKYNLNIKDCVVVGDRSLDVEGAYNASVDGILFDVDSRVFNHRATYVIKRLNQLHDFIENPNYIKSNYHTHTIRCGHALGSDEQYIENAIKNGLQEIGFSDHVMIPDISKNYEYIETFNLLKEKYKDQIEIKIGLECEYMEYYLPFYKKLLDEKLVDYLIFGNHGYCNKNDKSRQDLKWFFDRDITKEELDIYYDNLEKAINTGLFKFIAHPDIFLKGYKKWDEYSINVSKKILKLLQDNNFYVEFNVQGLRGNSKMEYLGKQYYCYPFDEFFKLAKSYNLQFIIGLDAHSHTQFADKYLDYALNKIKELDLNIINLRNNLDI